MQGSSERGAIQLPCEPQRARAGRRESLSAIHSHGVGGPDRASRGCAHRSRGGQDSRPARRRRQQRGIPPAHSPAGDRVLRWNRQVLSRRCRVVWFKRERDRERMRETSKLDMYCCCYYYIDKLSAFHGSLSFRVLLIIIIILLAMIFQYSNHYQNLMLLTS